MVALHEGQPKLLNLKQILEAFLSHRREVVTRRTIFELRKARDRAHVLEGQAVALANIDEVIALIKASPSPAEAKTALIAQSWPPGAVMEMLEQISQDGGNYKKFIEKAIGGTGRYGSPLIPKAHDT